MSAAQVSGMANTSLATSPPREHLSFAKKSGRESGKLQRKFVDLYYRQKEDAP
jgi:hypothetical protein